MRLIAILSVFLNLISTLAIANEVNIFSARHYDSDIQLYKKFTEKTGIKVNVVSGKSNALEKRILEEGEDCIADLYIAADAGRLGAAEAKGMLQDGLSSSLILKYITFNCTQKYHRFYRVSGNPVGAGLVLFFGRRICSVFFLN